MKNVTISIFACFLIGALHSQEVDQFTGAFTFNKELLQVPSSRGAAVSIMASYKAGIKNDQAASEIGLGWELGAGGAIYRQVSGYPDDALNYSQTKVPGIDPVIAQGALYTSYGTANKYDLDTKRNGIDTIEYTFPDFDKYQVSGPQLSGNIKLSYQKFYSYNNVNISSSPNINRLVPNTHNLTANGFPGAGYFRKPQFHFENDFNDSLVSRHYPITPITSGTPFRDPTYSYAGLGYSSSSFEPFFGPHLIGGNVSTTSENYDIATGRMATNNFIEYFTNEEIDYGNTNSALGNFIDYKSNHARPALTSSPYTGEFPAEGIGAFRITTPDGLTYHYSLPVYELEKTEYQFPLNNDYALQSGFSASAFTDYNPLDLHPNTNFNTISIKSISNNKIAVKWLLTAVTGHGYVDHAPMNIVDDNDEGYWVSYEYEQWSKEFITRTPNYGFEYSYSPDEGSQRLPIYFPFAPATGQWRHKNSGVCGIVNINKSEVYHLKQIRTSSHTAIFVRDTRKDERGSHETKSIGSNFKPAPDLLLKRILLFRNQEIDSITAVNGSGFSQSDFLYNTQFEFAQINNSSSFYTEHWYQAYQNSWKYCILKNIEFDLDYTLSLKYHGNIDVTCNASDVLSTQNYVQNNLTVNNFNQSGRLTLKRILTYGFQNIKLVPSLKFEYDYNPVYYHNKQDYWGYFKADATQDNLSRYTNAWSKGYTNAWSLKKIIDPFGGETEIEYESNSYSRVLDNESTNGVRGAAFIYRIKAPNCDATNAEPGLPNGNNIAISSNFDMFMEEGANGPLNEFSALCGSSLSGLQKKICIPFYLDENSFNNSEWGFLQGDCNTLNVSNSQLTGIIAGSSTNHNYVYTRHQINGSRFFCRSGYGTPLSVNTAYTDWPTNYDVIGYSGNGFVMFETPIGYEVYGGGGQG